GHRVFPTRYSKIGKAQDIRHGIKPRLLALAPARGGKRPARENDAVLGLVGEFEPLGGPRENHRMLADDAAAAKRRKTNVACFPRAGMAVAAALLSLEIGR